jgi:hypothetical protein
MLRALRDAQNLHGLTRTYPEEGGLNAAEGSDLWS